MYFFTIQQRLTQLAYLKRPGALKGIWCIGVLAFLLSYTSVTQAQDCPSLTITASPSLTLARGTTGKLTVSGADSYTWSTGAHSTTLTASFATTATPSTTYSVTGTTGGCSVTASVQVVQVAACPFEQINPCGVTGNTYPSYSFFHIDGTSSYTFAPGETIYNIASSTTGACASPSTFKSNYATLPSVAKLLCPNAAYLNYVTSSINTDGSYGYVSKNCQKVGPLQYLMNTEQKFSIDTPGDYPITFADGTTRTLTIATTAVPATNPSSVTLAAPAVLDGTLSFTAIPGSPILTQSVLTYSTTSNGLPIYTAYAHYNWLVGGNSLASTRSDTNTYVVPHPIWGQTYQVQIIPAQYVSLVNFPLPHICGLQPATVISDGFTVPYPSAQLSSATACAGSTLSLSANVPYGTAPYSYTWVAPPGITLDNPNASPTTATINPGVSGVQTFTVTIMDSATPTPQVSTTTVSVNVVSPLILTATPSLTVTAGQSVTLSASGGATSYRWSDGSSGPTLTVNPTNTTTYSVTGTSSNGCSVTTSAAVSVTQPVESVSVCVAGGCPEVNGTYVDSALPTWQFGELTTLRALKNTNQDAYILFVTNNDPVELVKQWVIVYFDGTSANSRYLNNSTLSETIPTNSWEINTENSACTDITVTMGACLPCSLTVGITAAPSLTITSGGSVTLTASEADSYVWSDGSTTNPLVLSSVTSATTLSVTGTTGQCSATATVAVSVIQATPIISVSPLTLSTTVCMGEPAPQQSFTVSGSNLSTAPGNSLFLVAPAGFEILGLDGYTHEFGITIPDDGVVAPTTILVRPLSTATAGTLSGNVTLTSSGATSQSVAVSVLVNAPPTVSITATPSLTITNSQPISLTASGATTYLWSNGATTASISPTLGGIYSVTGTTGACSAATSVTVTAADLSPTLVLPQANFAASGTTNNFLVNIYEVNHLPTNLGTIAITVTAPVGYTLAFDNSLNSIAVTGSTDGPVTINNTNWTVINTVDNRQLSLQIKPGQSIAPGATMNLGFSITRTTANSGSASNITVNIADDPTKGYDGSTANNVYARIINGL